MKDAKSVCVCVLCLGRVVGEREKERGRKILREKEKVLNADWGKMRKQFRKLFP